jgi:hypothetical protein
MAYRQIKFPVHYYKVCGQETAELLDVREMVVSNKDDQTYIRYEVRSEETMDGERDGRYAQLIFLGNKGIPFSHLVDSKMLDFYKGLVGVVFNIVTPSDSRKEWMRRKYGK